MKIIAIEFCLIILFCSNATGQKLNLLWKSDTVFKIPESVLFDPKEKVLYISNIEGRSSEKDGKGFISKMDPTGKIISLKWVSGLNAPKGMGLFGNKLYVADLTEVAVIDVTSGKLEERIAVEGANFLNDITVNEKGNIFISDSGTGRIYVLKTGEPPAVYFQSPQLSRINGLLALKGNELYVADAGTGFNYKLSGDKKLTKFSTTSQGADGIISTGKNRFIVSSWGGEVYYVDAKGTASKILDTRDQKLNSADIAYQAKKRVVFVPTFSGNSIMAYSFTK